MRVEETVSLVVDGDDSNPDTSEERVDVVPPRSAEVVVSPAKLADEVSPFVVIIVLEVSIGTGTAGVSVVNAPAVDVVDVVGEVGGGFAGPGGAGVAFSLAPGPMFIWFGGWESGSGSSTMGAKVTKCCAKA